MSSPDHKVGIDTLAEMDRRRFLRLASLAPLAVIGTPATAAAPALAFMPSVFDAAPDAVLIWVRGAGPLRVRVDVAEETQTPQWQQGPAASLSVDTDYCAALPVSGLAPGRTWRYRVVDAQGGGVLFDGGGFRTAPLAPAPFTFAFSGDMGEDYQPFRLFDVIAARRPHFFLHLGDTVYADHPHRRFNPSLAHYRAKHAANRKDRHLQQFMSRHATYAVWDDHEVENNCNASHPHMAAGLQAFKEYWPGRHVDPNALYRRFNWAGADFFILDTRRFRSVQTQPEGPDKTMLGEAQKAWFRQHLKASVAPFKFVVTSVPFHGGSSEAWGTYRTERDEIARYIKAEGIGGVIFLTADYHLARDWTSARTGLREFMAGPIASSLHYSKNPGARARYEKAGAFHYGDGYNFGLWQVDCAAGKARLEFVGADGATLFQTELTA